MDYNTSLEPKTAEQNQTWFQKHRLIIAWVLSIVFIIFIVVVVYVNWPSCKNTKTENCGLVGDRSKIIVDLKDMEWKTYKNSQFGFEISVPNDIEQETVQYGVIFKSHSDKPTSVASVFFSTTNSSLYNCSERYNEDLDQWGWSKYITDKSFCAINGVYEIQVFLNTEDEVLNQKILSSIVLSQNQLQQPKYTIYCEESDYHRCSLYKHDYSVIERLFGWDYGNKLNDELIVAYEILGWDTNRIIISGVGGAECYTESRLYSITLSNLTITKIAEAIAECPKNAQEDEKANKSYDDYEAVKTQVIKSLPYTYPEINLNQ